MCNKLILITICICMTTLLFIACSNVDKVQLDELTQNWMRDGYPDDIGGIFFSNETDAQYLYIAVVGLTNKRASQIQDLVKNPENIRFINVKYSYKQLSEIMQKIESDLSENDGIYGVGIDEENNRVVVDVDQTSLKKVTNIYEKLYGDMVMTQSGTSFHANQ